MINQSNINIYPDTRGKNIKINSVFEIYESQHILLTYFLIFNNKIEIQNIINKYYI